MKRLTVLFLIALFALALCACGQAPAAPADEPAPVEETAEPAPAETPAPEQTEAPAPDADLLALAETFVGRPVSELIAAIGDPLATDYAPSCLGPGEDGELTYEGFTVYTYREGDTELVEEVYHAP